MRVLNVPAVAPALLAVVVLAGAARAQVAVGDELEPAFKTIDGKVLAPDDLAGKMVVLHLWPAKKCEPCEQVAPVLVELEQQYRAKGLLVIDVVYGGDAKDAAAAAKERGYTWPTTHDPDGAVFRQFFGPGQYSVPMAFLVRPGGTVHWIGHPGNMEEELELAFAKHAPVVVDPAVLRSARAALAKVDEHLKAGDPLAALKSAASIPAETEHDVPFAKALAGRRAKLKEAADALLASVDADADAGRAAAAADRLREMTVALAGQPAGDAAKEKLAELMADPKAQKAIAVAQKEAKAAPELAAAEKLRDAKKREAAYAKFRQVAKAYAGTPSGDKAAAAVKAFEADKAFMKSLAARESAGKAKSALSVARNYAKAGRTAEAAKKYKSIIADFPGTEHAATAQAELDALK